MKDFELHQVLKQTQVLIKQFLLVVTLPMALAIKNLRVAYGMIFY
jgi:hypothetical protein